MVSISESIINSSDQNWSIVNEAEEDLGGFALLQQVISMHFTTKFGLGSIKKSIRDQGVPFSHCFSWGNFERSRKKHTSRGIWNDPLVLESKLSIHSPLTLCVL
jgi:hypothetical protein